MYIKERIDTAPLGALPRAYYALQNSTHLPSLHEELHLRHPFSIYAVSLSTIRERIEKLLVALRPIFSSDMESERHREEYDAAIRDATDALLDSLMEHFDDCCNVLKCYSDSAPHKVKKKVFAIVQTNWGTYRDHIGQIVNFIKHKQRRVRTVVFNGDGWVAPGYFIEGPAGPKMLGPDPQIHSGGGTAFSFRRSVMFHVCGVYAVSRSMVTGLTQIDKTFLDVNPQNATAKPEEIAWTGTMSKIASLGNLVFPDEFRQSNPVVKVAGTRLTVECPSDEKPVPVPRSGKISTLFPVDAMSPSYRLPYRKDEDRHY